MGDYTGAPCWNCACDHPCYLVVVLRSVERLQHRFLSGNSPAQSWRDFGSARVFVHSGFQIQRLRPSRRLCHDSLRLQYGPGSPTRHFVQFAPYTLFIHSVLSLYILLLLHSLILCLLLRRKSALPKALQRNPLLRNQSSSSRTSNGLPMIASSCGKFCRRRRRKRTVRFCLESNPARYVMFYALITLMSTSLFARTRLRSTKHLCTSALPKL